MSNLSFVSDAVSEPVFQSLSVSFVKIPAFPFTLLLISNVVNNSFDSINMSCIKSKSDISPSDVLNTFTLFTSPANVSNCDTLILANEAVTLVATFEPLSIL